MAIGEKSGENGDRVRDAAWTSAYLAEVEMLIAQKPEDCFALRAVTGVDLEPYGGPAMTAVEFEVPTLAWDFLASSLDRTSS